MLTETVDAYIDHYKLIKSNTTLIVGVSGGPDSMALLHYLMKKQEMMGLRLVVVSVDHSLRQEGSAQDLAYVRQFAEKNNLIFEGRTVDVPAYKERYQLGTQEAARTLRYQAYHDVMQAYEADYLVLGHHADDQIETIFMRLSRNTNLDGLGGMRKARPFSIGLLIRPFLSVTKDMITAYCASVGIEPRLDPSNEHDQYTRNYFRHHILPLIKEYNPNLDQTIQQFSEHVADDVDYLNEEAEKLRRLSRVEGSFQDDMIHEIDMIKKHPRALQRRLFHLILNYLYDTLPKGLTFRHEQQFFELLQSEKPNLNFDLPNDLKMLKNYNVIRFSFRKEPLTYEQTLSIPGETRLPTGVSVFTDIVSKEEVEESDDFTFYLPIDTKESIPTLWVRTRQPGDRIYLAYLNGRKKLKSLFIDRKIPLQYRDEWPILVDEKGRVRWVMGLTKSEDHAELEKANYIKVTISSIHMF
ncbi:tRNA(Ile)-lysidine synthase [Pelagirhabdus alkalitolerans]|uniref:tRNA(Ile)-lysidine synthase n=1 Tax=Pelagirhabdus alkalitolerans TaxID=1612202 RepID=A0A1G6MIF5_9BACI|nr:tRNA lysidine(34) synthetase TilS [Pelagirhabdus alkalitolerans]SDC54766.1 tRNA(Ile)-lysidine synthase [Pelagirhabdus alkalitolerans]